MTKVAVLALLGVMALPGMAFAACDVGMKTPTIPDGAKATEAELVAAQQQVKAYNAAVVAYQSCLEKEEADATAAGTETPDAKKARVKKFNEAGEAVQKVG